MALCNMQLSVKTKPYAVPVLTAVVILRPVLPKRVVDWVIAHCFTVSSKPVEVNQDASQS